VDQTILKSNRRRAAQNRERCDMKLINFHKKSHIQTSNDFRIHALITFSGALNTLMTDATKKSTIHHNYITGQLERR
ncbi:hypothetical protein, partial [Xanthomonas vasicola]